MPIARPKTTGAVIIRRFVPPQFETEAKISKGELKENIKDVASRLELQECDEDPLNIVNDQGLVLMSKLFDSQIYYLAGGCPKKQSVSDENYSNIKKPDQSVIWSFDKRVLLHEPVNHRSPETPYRLQRALEMLENDPRASLLLPGELISTPVAEGNLAQYCRARLASLSEICSFHAEERYKDFVERGKSLENLKTDVYCNEGTSSDAARISAAAVIDIAVYVLQNISAICTADLSAAERLSCSTMGLCLVRPPGHHCSCDTPSGFCLINNVAVAASWILEKHKFGLEKGSSLRKPKIAIIDLDVHFGEGTASFVDNYQHKGDSSFPLLYLSLHRYDKGGFYPFYPEGSTEYTGRKNVGSICNVGVNTNAHIPSHCHEVISDILFEKVMNEVFIPRLTSFQPDLIFVSLGFDAAYGDPLGKMAVEGGFAKSMIILKNWCSSRACAPVGLVTVLEGGYNPESVSTGLVSVAHALTFPEDDPEVQKLSATCVPKVWGDLRKRQERRNRELLSNEEGIESSTTCETVDSDAELLKKHDKWCDELISKVKQLHGERPHQNFTH